MLHIGSFSGGLSSAIACDRMLDKYGSNNCELVTMDTKAEDSDNWRFARDCSHRWDKKITVLRDGRTPRQVAEQKQIIPNQKIAPCTFELKIKPFREYIKKYKTITIHIGYDVFEAHRCDAVRQNYEAEGYNVDFPLFWKPIEARPYARVVREDWGIEPPRSYDMGFSHANCLKQFCFKAGQGDAIRFLINFPDRFKSQEDWEQIMRQHPKRRNYAILRDQSNGEVRPLTLKELRERYEQAESCQPSFFDKLSPACVSCGVGDFISDKIQAHNADYAI